MRVMVDTNVSLLSDTFMGNYNIIEQLFCISNGIWH